VRDAIVSSPSSSSSASGRWRGAISSSLCMRQQNPGGGWLTYLRSVAQAARDAAGGGRRARSGELPAARNAWSVVPDPIGDDEPAAMVAGPENPESPKYATT
jgi:hypothetical protein